MSVLGCWLLAGGLAHATGFYGPSDYLSDGGAQVDAAPEFYWDLEMKRLAREFHPAEAPKVSPKVFPPRAPTVEMYSLEDALERPTKLTADADSEDFADALQAGRIKPPDAAKAQEQHDAGRSSVAESDETLPTEFPSEFADYHRGALAFRRGAKHYAEARQAWEALLARPPAERHYRSVWAAFMLGKLALKEAKPEAPRWFQQARTLAREGFADSLSLAADSYGWEGRSEWKQGHPERAAPLFLTQLALGDESAVESLKALIPGRARVEGMLNYGPEEEEMQSWTEAQRKAHAQGEQAKLRQAARDPLLRRLVTAHILATETRRNIYAEGDSVAAGKARVTRWLALLKEAGIKAAPDAEYLGWVAYHMGDYPTATRWLELAPVQTPAAHWLRAKLQRRGGQLTEAAQSMVLAWKTLRAPTGYTGWHEPPPEPADESEPTPAADPAAASKAAADEKEEAEDPFADHSYDGTHTFAQEAGGNLAGLALARNDFVQAFETFRQAHLWEDAAFVAESIFTVDELKTYVDRETAEPTVQIKDPSDGNLMALRWLLGRRLVRADRYAEAAAYLKPPFDKMVAVYAKALEDGANSKLTNVQRAEAWFRAAWLARYDGMELMGTEVAPDGFLFGGDFQSNGIAQQRRLGKKPPEGYYEGNGKKLVLQPIALPATKVELERLQKNRLAPDVRFHYRVIAGALAMKAAALLPDQSPELADVLNKAGGWMTDRDDKAADQAYVALLRRAGKTELGRTAREKKWFVDEGGPWSDREMDAREKLGSELEPKTP